MTRLFSRGTEYQSAKEWGQLLYGKLQFFIGRLDMPDQHIQENMEAFVKSLVQLRPPEYGNTVVCLWLLETSFPEAERRWVSRFVSFKPEAY